MQKESHPIDKPYSIKVVSGNDYKLGVKLRGGLVNVSLDGAVVASHIYNETRFFDANGFECR